MFPPDFFAGSTASPLAAGEITEERDTERNRSEQEWRLSSDPQGKSEIGNRDPQLSASPPPLTAVPLRRVHSEYTFRFPDEVNLGDVASPGTSGSFERIPGARDEEDHNLLASYMDLEKIEGAEVANQRLSALNDEPNDNDNDSMNAVRRRCHSADDMCGGSSNGNSNNKKAKIGNCEVKKAMSPDKLAELWVLDPKRAKRILANRQSAARSKERKAQYMVELEKKAQSLRTEATSLSVQLALFERDTTGLNNENAELRHQLETMEQHAHLRDALIDALQREVERLKAATGEATTPADTFMMPVNSIPQQQAQSQSQPQSFMVESTQPRLTPLYPYESTMSHPNHVDLSRPKVRPFPSFEMNDPCSHALDSHKTKKSRINQPEPTLLNLQQSTDPSNTKSKPLHTSCEPNLFNLHPQKLPSVYPPDPRGLYLSHDSSKARMPQFCTTETNTHPHFQPTQSNHGLPPQDSFEQNFFNSGSQWTGRGRSGGVLDRSGLVPVGYWAV